MAAFFPKPQQLLLLASVALVAVGAVEIASFRDFGLAKGSVQTNVRVAAADLDGDGDNDLLLHVPWSPDNHDVYWYPNDGAAGFATSRRLLGRYNMPNVRNGADYLPPMASLVDLQLGTGPGADVVVFGGCWKYNNADRSSSVIIDVHKNVYGNGSLFEASSCKPLEALAEPLRNCLFPSLSFIKAVLTRDSSQPGVLFSIDSGFLLTLVPDGAGCLRLDALDVSHEQWWVGSVANWAAARFATDVVPEVLTGVYFQVDKSVAFVGSTDGWRNVTSWANVHSFANGDSFTALASLDYDGDGLLDVVFSDGNGWIVAARHTVEGEQWAAPVPLPRGSSSKCYVMTVSDVNDDGFADLVCSTGNAPFAPTVLIADGAGWFFGSSALMSVTGPTPGSSLAVARFKLGPPGVVYPTTSVAAVQLAPAPAALPYRRTFSYATAPLAALDFTGAHGNFYAVASPPSQDPGCNPADSVWYWLENRPPAADHKSGKMLSCASPACPLPAPAGTHGYLTLALYTPNPSSESQRNYPQHVDCMGITRNCSDTVFYPAITVVPGKGVLYSYQAQAHGGARQTYFLPRADMAAPLPATDVDAVFLGVDELGTMFWRQKTHVTVKRDGDEVHVAVTGLEKRLDGSTASNWGAGIILAFGEPALDKESGGRVALMWRPDGSIEWAVDLPQPPLLTTGAKDVRALVADMDSDGRDDVVLFGSDFGLVVAFAASGAQLRLEPATTGVDAVVAASVASRLRLDLLYTTKTATQFAVNNGPTSTTSWDVSFTIQQVSNFVNSHESDLRAFRPTPGAALGVAALSEDFSFDRGTRFAAFAVPRLFTPVVKQIRVGAGEVIKSLEAAAALFPWSVGQAQVVVLRLVDSKYRVTAPVVFRKPVTTLVVFAEQPVVHVECDVSGSDACVAFADFDGLSGSRLVVLGGELHIWGTAPTCLALVNSSHVSLGGLRGTCHPDKMPCIGGVDEPLPLSSLRLDNCTGTGVLLRNCSSVVVYNATVVGAQRSGVIVDGASHDVHMTHTRIEGCSNVQDSGGGGVRIVGEASVTAIHAVIENCRARNNGGGAYVGDARSALTLEDSVVRGCQAWDKSGGGLAFESSTEVTQVIARTVVEDNAALDSSGGGIHVDNSRLEMRGVSLLRNQARSAGGGLHALSTSTVEGWDVLFRQNRAVALSGGAVYVASSPAFTLHNSTIVENRADLHGGGIFGVSSVISVMGTRTNVSWNTADGGSGGGIYVAGSENDASGLINLHGSSSRGVAVVAHNRAKSGGAIAAVSSLFGVDWVQFTDNIATGGEVVFSSVRGGGGAIAALQANWPVVVGANATFTRNVALDGNGGAIWFEGIGSSSNLLISETDFIENNASEGGGGAVFHTSSSPRTNIAPGLRQNTENVAAYGRGVATEAVDVVVCADGATRIEQVSLEPLNGTLAFCLADKYEQRVTTAATSALSASFVGVSAAPVTFARGVTSYAGSSILNQQPGSTVTLELRATVPTGTASASVTFKMRDCEPGSFIKGTVCVPCEVGSSSAANALSCTPCPAGAFADAPGLPKCKHCPVHSFTRGEGNNVCSLCEIDTYLVGTDCRKCPTGALCQPGKAPQVQPGFWPEYNAAHELVGTVECAEERCGKSGQCTPNRLPSVDNPLCGRCADGFSEWGGQCVPCTRTNVSLWVALGVGLVICVAVYHSISQVSTGTLRITVYFWQMAILFIGRASWLQWSSLVNVQPLSVSGETCLAPFPPATKVAVELLLPLSTFVLLAALAKARQLFRPDGWRCEPYLRTATALFVFTFNVIVRGSLDVLNCVEASGERYMVSTPAIACNDATYVRLVALAYALLAVYLVVVPAAFAWRLVTFRRAGVLDEEDIKDVWGALYEPYETHYYYWTLVSLGRRVLLVALWVFLYESRANQLGAVALVNTGVAFVQVLAQPYVDMSDNHWEFASLAMLTLLTTALTMSPAAWVQAALVLPMGVALVVRAGIVKIMNRCFGRGETGQGEQERDLVGRWPVEMNHLDSPLLQDDDDQGL